MGYDVQQNDSARCQHMQKLLISLGAVLGVLLGGCSVVSWPGIYKIDVQQGQPITQQLVDQLYPGMTHQQVSYVMGTPLMVDPFHDGRWDYVYTFQPGGGEREQRHLSLFFTGDKLARIEGDLHPSGDPAAAARAARHEQTIEVKGGAQPPGLLQELKSSVGLGGADTPSEPHRPIPGAGPRDRPESP
jgi:outer membrane protein assembly factor BamE